MDKNSTKGDNSNHSAVSKEGIFVKGTIVNRTRRLQMFTSKFPENVVPENPVLTSDNHMFIVTYFVSIGINKELISVSDTGNGNDDVTKTALETTEHTQVIPITIKSYLDRKGVLRTEYSRIHDVSSQFRLRKNEEIF
jgi:hypothetical protein